MREQIPNHFGDPKCRIGIETGEAREIISDAVVCVRAVLVEPRQPATDVRASLNSLREINIGAHTPEGWRVRWYTLRQREGTRLAHVTEQSLQRRIGVFLAE